MILRLVTPKPRKVYVALFHSLYFSYPNVHLRTCTKNRVAFCVELSSICAAVYKSLQENNHKF